MSLLESVGCRLASVVSYTEPSQAMDGRLFYRSGMTRGMLVTFIRSLTVGELVLSRGVTVGEALATFEYEGVSLTSTLPKPVVDMPRAGVAFSKRTDEAKEMLSTLCNQVADAILHWPRLEAVLDLSLIHI